MAVPPQQECARRYHRLLTLAQLAYLGIDQFKGQAKDCCNANSGQAVATIAHGLVDDQGKALPPKFLNGKMFSYLLEAIA